MVFPKCDNQQQLRLVFWKSQYLRKVFFQPRWCRISPSDFCENENGSLRVWVDPRRNSKLGRQWFWKTRVEVIIFFGGGKEMGVTGIFCMWDVFEGVDSDMILFLICSWILVWVLILQKARWTLIEMIYFPDFSGAQNPNRSPGISASSFLHTHTNSLTSITFNVFAIRWSKLIIFTKHLCKALGWYMFLLIITLPCSRSKWIRAERDLWTYIHGSLN